MRWPTPRLGISLLLGAALVVSGGKPSSAGGGDADWRMPVELPAFGGVAITVRSDPAASPPAAVMLLENAAGNPVYRFPPLPGTGSYAYFQTRDMAIADIDKDGQDDLVVIIEVMTGIGPSGAEPFPLAGVYLSRADGFERAAALEERLDDIATAGSPGDLQSRLDDLGPAPDLPD